MAGDWHVSHLFPQQCFLIHINPKELKQGSWRADPNAFAKTTHFFFSLNNIISGIKLKCIVLMKHYFSSHCFKSVCKWLSLSLSMSEHLIIPLATNCLRLWIPELAVLVWNHAVSIPVSWNNVFAEFVLHKSLAKLWNVFIIMTFWIK